MDFGKEVFCEGPASQNCHDSFPSVCIEEEYLGAHDVAEASLVIAILQISSNDSSPLEICLDI
eukprot:8802466-Karenia_brevis.AAC.1